MPGNRTEDNFTWLDAQSLQQGQNAIGYSLNPSLLRTSTNSGWSRMDSEKIFDLMNIKLRVMSDPIECVSVFTSGPPIVGCTRYL